MQARKKRSRVSQMALYAYAIIDSNSKIEGSISGLEGACVYNIPYRDIGVAVSELNEQIQNINQEHILKHEEVVEKLMQTFTVLPMRFSTQFSQEKDLLLMMQEYYGDFRENLDKLRNKVEFGIKIIWSAETIKNRIIEASKKCHANVAPATLDNSPENPMRNTDHRSRDHISNGARIFVKEKFEKYKIDKEFQDEADRCIALLDDFFSRFAAEKKLEKLKSDNLLLSAYYLVEKEKQGDFKEAFERAKNTPGDLKYLFSGPWPPYNFIVLTKKPDIFTPLEILKTIGNTSF